jgi:hypothetical protein
MPAALKRALIILAVAIMVAVVFNGIFWLFYTFVRGLLQAF